ncbi:M4 family metallopeptidase [Vitiosangium sp. GDMCC 1.1324]|uniref:M4 family metallopeptidase n=1 Tax=Vitiosangium sp. (strain GDMCC 1.1324) TaxID=2138576 RepID=UPI000D38D24F|nr:M4 family metallopeptidase [Vitiosangium sp. GDMCC 1.1324]PTL80608.1 peptidase M4 [Vitiosangium sp. GDMCC 1.1324]
MSASGLQSFAFHRHEQSDVVDAIRPIVGFDRPLPDGRPAIAGLDPETAARRYLTEAFASPALPTFNTPEIDGKASEFRTLGTENVPLTGTQVVKFRQVYRRIPIYGSLITVELDENNELLALNSTLGTPPADLNVMATLSPAQAMDVVRQRAGQDAESINALPRLVFYFHEPEQHWHLAYLVENVTRRQPDTPKGAMRRAPELMDYIVDAHSGNLIAELPRTQSIHPQGMQPTQELLFRRRRMEPEFEEAADGLGVRRKFAAKKMGEVWKLIDSELNVHTYDFSFHDLERDERLLPGAYVGRPPEPWDPAAVSAHANAVAVALFLRKVLKREGLDNRGGPVISSINCCYGGGGGKEWHNAAWIGTQMVYGQRAAQGGGIRSYAVALDVVAHEILHGLTDHTARLEYAGMSGALNESYSDIFGVIVSNLNNPDVGTWNWEMGEELETSGIPIRDLSQPEKYNQPAHMKDYEFLAVGPLTDWGGVHTNSGIHNKAAYHLLTSKDAQGNFLFDPREVAAIFYLALTQHLSRTSKFIDSRRGVELAARTFLRNDPRQKEKLAAIGAAFDAVGITSNLGANFEPNKLSS